MIVSLEIKDFHSPDVHEVWNWTPNDDSEVEFLLEMTIGEKGGEAGSVYDVVVVSVEALRLKRTPFVISGKHRVIVSNYTWEALTDFLRELIDSCASHSEEEAAKKLASFFAWEYENYVPP